MKMTHGMNQSAEVFIIGTHISPPQSSETELTKYNYTQYHVSRELFVYVPPFILLFGITGNILAAIVMSRKRMRISPSVLYIRVIAIADIIVLIIGFLPRWIKGITHVDIIAQNQWICKFRKFIFYGAGDVSVWLLTAFTVERFIAVCFPLNTKRLCTHKRIHIITVVIIFVAVAVNLPLFWIYGIEYDHKNGTSVIRKMCGHPTPAIKHFSRNIRPWIVLVYYCLVPFAIILICNVAIIRTMMLRKDIGEANNDQNLKKEHQQAYFITAMALSISFALLVLLTPGVVIYSMKLHIPKDEYSQAVYSLMNAVGDLLLYTNHAINFYLYCLTGRRFRKELKSLFRKRRSSGDYFRRQDTTSSTALRSMSLTTTTTVVNQIVAHNQIKKGSISATHV